MSVADIKKSDIVAQFQRAQGDTGSPEVQVALLTARINELTAVVCCAWSAVVASCLIT